MNSNNNRANSLDVISEPPRTTAELWTFCEQGRQLAHRGADLLEFDAVELRFALGLYGGGNPWLMGVDNKIAARRVARHLLLGARAFDLAALEFRRTWFTFQELYLNNRGSVPRGRRVFIVNDQQQYARRR